MYRITKPILLCILSDFSFLFAVSNKIPTVIVLMSNIFMDAWQMSAVSDVPQKRAQFFSRVFLCYQALLCTAASGLILFSKVITSILVADSYYSSWKYIPLLLIVILIVSSLVVWVLSKLPGLKKIVS